MEQNEVVRLRSVGMSQWKIFLRFSKLNT